MPVQIGLSQILVLCYFATEKRALKKKLEGEYECNKYFIFVAHRALFCVSALASSQHSSKFQHLWTCFGNLWFPLDFRWRWATTVQASSCTPALGGVSPKRFSYVGFGSMHTLCCLFIYFSYRWHHWGLLGTLSRSVRTQRDVKSSTTVEPWLAMGSAAFIHSSNKKNPYSLLCKCTDEWELTANFKIYRKETSSKISAAEYCITSQAQKVLQLHMVRLKTFLFYSSVKTHAYYHSVFIFSVPYPINRVSHSVLYCKPDFSVRWFCFLPTCKIIISVFCAYGKQGKARGLHRWGVGNEFSIAVFLTLSWSFEDRTSTLIVKKSLHN